MGLPGLIRPAIQATMAEVRDSTCADADQEDQQQGK
jgi:hypothetical protein